MSDIDFQNGFLCGIATKGLVQSTSTLGQGYLLAGHLIMNGSRGVWPLVLIGDLWVAQPIPSSCYYVIESPRDQFKQQDLSVNRNPIKYQTTII